MEILEFLRSLIFFATKLLSGIRATPTPLDRIQGNFFVSMAT